MDWRKGKGGIKKVSYESGNDASIFPAQLHRLKSKRKTQKIRVLPPQHLHLLLLRMSTYAKFLDGNIENKVLKWLVVRNANYDAASDGSR